jgi:hypothetical protein
MQNFLIVLRADGSELDSWACRCNGDEELTDEVVSFCRGLIFRPGDIIEIVEKQELQ